jgi:hypothetical protein
VLFLVAAAAILKVVVLPSYQDHTVVETLAPATTPAPAPVAEVTPSTVTVTAPPALPVKVRSDSLTGIDHRAGGTVNIYRHSDGHTVVGLEQFDIQPGPAYALYLVEGDNQQSLHDSVRLSSLRGNRGTQFYDAPETFALGDGPWTVLVWCETFDVPVANATPRT